MQKDLQEVSYPCAMIKLENHLIFSSAFLANAAEALGYVEKTAPIASKEIFPWLPAEKYTFVIISPNNLKKVLEEKVNRAISSVHQGPDSRKILRFPFP